MFSSKYASSRKLGKLLWKESREFACRLCTKRSQQLSSTTTRHAATRATTTASRPSSVMNVFDRKAKRHQRNVAAKLPDHQVYDYLKDEVACRLIDRFYDVSRQFSMVLDLGCGKGHLSKHVSKDDIDVLYQCDMSANMLDRCTSQDVCTVNLVADEESLPFYSNSFDAVFSSLSLHWVNDLPGVLRKVHNCLKEDGLFLAAMFGGDTLYELRTALQLAEIEQEGGFAPHISPLAQMTDCGNLLTRAGFSLTTVVSISRSAGMSFQISLPYTALQLVAMLRDYDDIIIEYPSIVELMQDLKGMGENNAAWNRKSVLHKRTVNAASKIYKEYYGTEDGTIPATFQVLYLIGWKPSSSQAQPAERGSANVSFKDISTISNNSKKKPS
eukprot:gene16576-18262_t